jgi:3-methyl-2-oxobutanoate hydroxymethyltransferase
VERKKVTITELQAKKARGEPITMLTAYDYPSAVIIDRAEIDVILVGDSLGMVVLGYDSTLPVTMEEMLHHARAVRRGARYAFLVGDMPFMSYQTGERDALLNAARFLKEAGMDAVKLEGGHAVVPVVEALVKASIPVMGHIGLQPQSIAKYGGFKIQGRDAANAHRLLDEAQALQAAGVFAIVLEGMPAKVAEWITGRIDVPTIGIGAGVGCDGQVLVFHDLLGLFDRFTPKFVKRYAQIGEDMVRALEAYRDEVRARAFPGAEHAFAISEDEWNQVLAEEELRENRGYRLGGNGQPVREPAKLLG